jgi:hypothetical protein
VWDITEYEKLPEYDRPTFDQPIGVFLCHQQDGRVCAGWCGTHDMGESLAIRLSSADNRLEDLDAILDYETVTPLWGSGEEAAAHGVEDLVDPGPEAQRLMANLRKKSKS